MSNALRSRGEFFAQRVDQLSDALRSALTIVQARAERRLQGLAPRLRPALALALQRSEAAVSRHEARLRPALQERVQAAEARLAQAAAKLTAYSPYGVLSRGYSLTTAADGSVVRDAASVRPGDRLTTRLAQGTVASVVA